MFCSKCGTNVTDGAAFCSACGQPTAGATTITPARPAPGLPPTYAPPVPTLILPSPYAGFWLRVVAHLIDDLLLGIGIGILVLIGVTMVGIDSIRSMAEGMKGEDFQMPAPIISAIFFVTIASIVLRNSAALARSSATAALPSAFIARWCCRHSLSRVCKTSASASRQASSSSS